MNQHDTTGLLISRDLLFISKIRGTASELGCTILVADDDTKARSYIQAYNPRVVFVDLASGAMTSPSALQGYRQLVDSHSTFIAFGSHVDRPTLEAARNAGCEIVLPRSRFVAELADLITQHLKSRSE